MNTTAANTHRDIYQIGASVYNSRMKQHKKAFFLIATPPLAQSTMAVVVAVFAMMFASCGRSTRAGSSGSGAMQNSMARNFKMASPRMMAQVADSAAIEMAEEPMFMDGDTGSSISSTSEGAVPHLRQLIHTANITIEVNDLDAAEEAIERELSSLSGYAANTSRSSTMLSIDMKVPASRFNDAVDDVAGMGKLIDKNVNAQDVTDRYYDLDSRINTKKILKERLESYLKSSANMKDLVAVETQLNSVISDLEAMQGQFTRLSNQIDYSSISVRFALPTGKTERGWKWPSISGKVRGFVVGAAGFFTTLALVVLGIALFSPPIVLLAALIYCLTFGKVGWVKKLFKKMGSTAATDNNNH